MAKQHPFKLNNRLYQDNHYHVEGGYIEGKQFRSLFEQSIKVFRKDVAQRKNIERVIQREFEQVIDDYEKSLHTKSNKTFTFETFLTKLYTTKIVLSSRPDIASKFISDSLNDLFKKYYHIQLGITPSVPVDFPQIDANDWDAAIIRPIMDMMNRNSEKRISVVIETKRQHFSQMVNRQFVYINNLHFLKNIQRKATDNSTFSLSICDDASKYPIFHEDRWPQFINYIDELEKYNNVRLNIHMLETLPDPDAVGDYFLERVLKTPSIELPIILDLLDQKEIYGVSLIHMCNVFEGVPYNPTERSKRDRVKVKQGKVYLGRIRERGDRIVVCYSSNKLLDNPFCLFYPEVLREVITGKINMTIGSDDPGPFNIRDVSQELDVLLEAQKEQPYLDNFKLGKNSYSTNEIHLLTRFALIRNSWRWFDYKQSKWREMSVREISNTTKLPPSEIEHLLGFDICKSVKMLKDGTVREKVIKREKEFSLWYNS